MIGLFCRQYSADFNYIRRFKFSGRFTILVLMMDTELNISTRL